MLNARHALAATLCLLALLACRREDSEYDDTTRIQIDTAAGVVDMREYTEAELLGFMGLANDGTIQRARLAEQRATTADVKALARMAIEDHTRLDRQAKDVAAELHLTPNVPTADENLAENQQKWYEEQSSTEPGTDWDKKYLAYEISRHETVLDEVNDALRREQRPEMKTFLESARTYIERHLVTFREAREKL